MSTELSRATARKIIEGISRGDLSVIDDLIAEGDRVVQRLTGRGTMQGELQGMPPTGKQAVWQEIHIARYRDGKAVEHWATIDQLGMMQQLSLAGYGIGG